MNEHSFFNKRRGVHKVLITGGFGNVGRSTVEACLMAGDAITILEAESPANRHRGRSFERRWAGYGLPPSFVFGDVRDEKTARKAVAGQDAVIHLAALIPPAADRRPELAWSVNVGGTANLLAACSELASPPRFVFASSVAAYGDRLADYWIKATDPLKPSPGDEYGRTKVEAEALVRSSGLPFAILRLTAIMSRKKLDPDPLLFSMPLATKLEICHTEDTGRAFARAARRDEALGRVLDIGGGEPCRCEYRGFLDRMFRLLGIGGIGGRSGVPESAFASSGFHCGWYADSDEADAILGFRSKGLEDYYAEVSHEARWIRPLASLVAPLVRSRLVAASPYFPR
jgi:nucleoside-diphosphate-sugar epimerase